MHKLRIVVGLWVLVLLAACSSRTVELGETFVLLSDERAQLAGEPLQVYLEGIGREWDDEGEYAFAVLQLKSGREEREVLFYVGETREFAGYAIELVSAIPFGETSAELRITQVDSP